MATSNQMKQASSDALSYFAVVANTEQSGTRRSFAKKAGDWIAEAVEKLGSNGIALKNTDAQERGKVLESQYELASEAIHTRDTITDIIRDATKIGKRDYHGGWNGLKETLKGRMDETLKLARDLDSLYSGENSLLLELAEREIIGDDGGEIDKNYVGMAVNCLNAAYMGVLKPAYQAWGVELTRSGNTFEVLKSGFAEEMKGYVDETNKLGMIGSALVLASADAIVGGKKITKEEFMDKFEKYRSDMNSQISSAMKQMQDAVKNPQLVSGADYKGQEFG